MAEEAGRRRETRRRGSRGRDAEGRDRDRDLRGGRARADPRAAGRAGAGRHAARDRYGPTAPRRSRSPGRRRAAAAERAAARGRSRNHRESRRPEVTPPPSDRRPRPPSSRQGGIRVRISPAARRRAAELGLDLASVRGTGPDGVVTLADVEARGSRPRRSAALHAGTTDRLRSGGDAQGDRRRDGALEARDPALLPDPHRRAAPRARLARGRQPRAAADRAPPARRAFPQGDRACAAQSPGAERLLGERCVPARDGHPHRLGDQRCAAAGSSRLRSTTPTPSRCPT